MRQATASFICIFVFMSEREKNITHFIDQLSQEVTIHSQQHIEGVYWIDLGEKKALIYPPNAPRLDVEELSCIHLDYDLILSDPQKIINRLKGLMGIGERIYARKTVVARVDKAVTQSFLAEHHLNGVMPGKYRYGLYYQGELVSIAVFSGGRRMPELGENHRSFELIRFCHKADILVIGGLSKMLKAFISDFSPQDIMTYVDRDWATQSSLETLGFQVVGALPPIKIAIVNGKRVQGSNHEEEVMYWVENKGSLKLKLIL